MNLTSLFHSELFTWVILPLLIFTARIFDVTIGTIRIIFVARGNKFVAPLLGFFEVLIWLLAIGQIMRNLNNALCYVAYAGGFATGNFVGIWLEERLAIGKLVIRIITQKNASQLIAALRRKGFGTTTIDAEGSKGKVNIVFTFINRKDLQKVIDVISKFNPRAFYSIEGTRDVKSGIFRRKRGFLERKILRHLRLITNRDAYRRLRAVRQGK